MKTSDIGTALQAPSQPHRRLLNIEEQRYLAHLLSTALKTDISEKAVAKIMNYVSYAEKRMVGRMASHVEDLIIHYVMRFVASRLDEVPDGVHLEIGTLFGGTVLLTHHASRLAEMKVPIHVIDPFEGYYGRGKDIITGESIDTANFLKNLASLDIPREEVVIHQGYSTAPEIITECQSLKLLSLLIDGDHSYAGIKSDWINFSPLVVPGGYVLIDNYNDQYWPDVMTYINGEVLPHLCGRWEIVLVYATSLLLRRTSVEQPDDSTDAQRLLHQLRAKDKEQELVRAKVEHLEHAKQQFENEIRLLADEKAQREQELANVRESLAASEAESVTKSDQLAGLDAELRDLRELYQAAQAQSDQANKQQLLLAEQVAALGAEREQELARLRESMAEIELDSGKKSEQLARLDAELKKLHELYLASLAESDKANEQQQLLVEQVAALRVEREQEVGRLRESLAASEVDSSGKSERLARLSSELNNLHELYLASLAESDRSNEQQHLLANQITTLRAEREREVASLRESLAASETECGRRGEQLSGLTGELKKLHELYVAALAESDRAAEQQQRLADEIKALQAERETELAQLGERLTAAEAESGRKSEQLARLSAELKSVHELYLAALAEIDKASEQQHPLTRQIAALQAELQARDAAISELHNSLSWKVTAPLRAIAKPVMEKGRD